MQNKNIFIVLYFPKKKKKKNRIGNHSRRHIQYAQKNLFYLCFNFVVALIYFHSR